MNKKFLSAILFGALMVTSTGTFVSCKDYDDDIDNLQEQIDKKAALTDLTTQLGTMQSALEAAKTAAADALKKATAAGEDVTALKDKIAKLETALSDVEALKAEMKQALADAIKDADIPGLKKQVEEQLAIVKTLAGGYLTMVTEVDLYYKAGQDDASLAGKLTFSNVTEQDNKFGPAGNQIEFKKGTDVATPTELIVRVVPANASLSPEMISLINGKGENISDQVTVTSVERYSELLTRSRASETGLWKIKFSLPKYEEKAFDKIAATTTGDILYALAVNDITTEATEGSEAVAHTAVSDYAVVLDYEPGKEANTLAFKVDDDNVSAIHNRYSSANETGATTPTNKIEDYIWAGDAATAIAKDKSNVKDKSAQAVGNDNRQDMPSKNVQVNIPFSVELVGDVMPRAFYVTLDESHAVESIPSELNAWKSYGIKGLNTLVDPATKLAITIPAEAAKGDYIGFRVYAVNYDGTLVDPDGRAFYVYVAGATTSATASVMFKPTTYAEATSTFKSDEAGITATGWTDATEAKLAKVYESTDADKVDKATALGVTLANFKLKKGTNPKTFTEAANETSRTELAKYTKVYMDGVEMAKLEDGKTYVAIINMINANANNTIVETVTVSFTKVLPTFPESVKPFTNILVDNVLKIYPKTFDAVETTKAIYDVDNVWHGVDAHTWFAQTNTTDENPATIEYVSTTKAAEVDATDNVPAFKVPAAIMNTENAAYGTKYPMEVTYDYGYMSYVGVNPDGDKKDDTYWTKGTKFDLVFGNYVDDCTFAWNGTAPTLVYPGAIGETSYIKLSAVKITDWYNRPAYLYETGTTTKTPALNGYSKNIKVELLTGDGKSVNEYYNPTIESDYQTGGTTEKPVKEAVILLTSKSTASQGSDVPTKIRLTIEDIYGGKVVKTFDPFTMTFKK